MRIIGDIHGDIKSYLGLTKSCDSSLQLGDLSFDYSFFEDYGIGKAHRFFGGNHDNYDVIKDCPHNLGDFGNVPGKPGTFFVRGAWSIDAKYRNEGIDYFRQEQLNYVQGLACIEEYARVKPDVLVSHECPFFLLPQVIADTQFSWRMGYSTPYIQTSTNMLLDTLHSIHRPKLHIFGHYHVDTNLRVGGTHFICLTADARNFPELKQRSLEV